MSSENIMEQFSFRKRCLSEEQEWWEKNRARFVGDPIRICSKIGRFVFSEFLGFGYPLRKLTQLSDYWGLPSLEVELPIWHAWGYTHPNDMEYYRSILIMQLGLTHKITPLNFPLLATNYIMKTLGNALGIIVGSIVSLPAYGLIKARHALKNTYASSEINKSLKQGFNGAQLSEFIFEEHIQDRKEFKNPTVKYQLSKVSKLITPEDMTTGITRALIKEENKNYSNHLVHGYMANSTSYDSRYGRLIADLTFEHYKEKRLNAFLGNKRKALAGVILTSLFIVPLFFTVPYYKKMAKRYAEESEKLVGNNPFSDTPSDLQQLVLKILKDFVTDIDTLLQAINTFPGLTNKLLADIINDDELFTQVVNSLNTLLKLNKSSIDKTILLEKILQPRHFDRLIRHPEQLRDLVFYFGNEGKEKIADFLLQDRNRYLKFKGTLKDRSSLLPYSRSDATAFSIEDKVKELGTNDSIKLMARTLSQGARSEGSDSYQLPPELLLNIGLFAHGKKPWAEENKKYRDLFLYHLEHPNPNVPNPSKNDSEESLYYSF